MMLCVHKVVKLLAGVYGVDFAAPASDGSTPLHWAASRGKIAVMKVLLGIFCAQVRYPRTAGVSNSVLLLDSVR